MSTKSGQYKSLHESISKLNKGAGNLAADILSRMEQREKGREKMKERINKDLDDVRKRPKRNLPV